MTKQTSIKLPENLVKLLAAHNAIDGTKYGAIKDAIDAYDGSPIPPRQKEIIITVTNIGPELLDKINIQVQQSGQTRNKVVAHIVAEYFK